MVGSHLGCPTRTAAASPPTWIGGLIQVQAEPGVEGRADDLGLPDEPQNPGPEVAEAAHHGDDLPDRANP